LTYRNYLRGLSFSTLIFGGVLLFMTLFLSPEKGYVIVVSYYLTLFFFTMGLTAIAGFFIRRWLSHNEMVFSNVKVSIRQAFLFALFLCILLLLSSTSLLNIWDGVILAFCFGLTELYLRSRSYNDV
jgi:hypothetical protein